MRVKGKPIRRSLETQVLSVASGLSRALNHGSRNVQAGKNAKLLSLPFDLQLAIFRF